MIARAGKPYLDLVPHREERQSRQPGRLKGEIELAEDCDETPDEIAGLFEGRE